MTLLAVGINHRTAPVELRERLALDGDRLVQALVSLSSCVPHGVVLSTCNRTEVYTLAPAPASAEKGIRRLLGRLSHLPQEELEGCLYSFHHRAVVEHLFRVAAGLDSMVLGESQVLGQVREALAVAQKHRLAGPLLSRLFRRSVETGKAVQAQTRLGRPDASVSYASVALAQRLFPSLKDLHILVIGAGEVGKLTVRLLKDVGGSQIWVTSRTHERAVTLAQSLGLKALPFSELATALGAMDLAISCTGAPQFVLTPALVRQAMASRPERPLHLIDIAVPRDINPTVRLLPCVFLYDIDDLQTAVNLRLEQQASEITKAEAIITQKVDSFMAWWKTSEALPVLTALRQKAEAIRRAEVAKTLCRMNGLSSEDKGRLDTMTTAIVNKLLHLPSVRLKAGGNAYVEAAHYLFGLDDGSVGSTTNGGQE